MQTEILSFLSINNSQDFGNRIIDDNKLRNSENSNNKFENKKLNSVKTSIKVLHK